MLVENRKQFQSPLGALEYFSAPPENGQNARRFNKRTHLLSAIKM